MIENHCKCGGKCSLLQTYVMEWSGRRTGHRQRSQENGDHSRRMSAIRFYLLSSRQFSAHPKSSLARTDKRMAWAARNTCYRYNEIAPLDHKMADDCVFGPHKYSLQ